MVKFGDYLENCAVRKYSDKYIRYNELKTCLDRAIRRKINGQEEFYRTLEHSYIITKDFAEEWIVKLESEVESRSVIISEVLELNQVCKNVYF